MSSTYRVLDVLELLARSIRPLPTMVIARECAIPKSSAHTLLNAMRDRGFVTHYGSERTWGLGVAALEIGSSYLRSEPLQRLGHGTLVDLADRSGATSHLATLHGTEVLYIDKQQPVGPTPKLVTEIGVRLPAHLTAVGRAILAWLSEVQVRALYPDQPLVRRTNQGPISVERLLNELASVRESGYAFDDGMVSPGISCLACPVFSHDGIPVAALGVTFVAAQRSRADVAATVVLVRELSARLSAALGYGRRSEFQDRSAGRPRMRATDQPAREEYVRAVHP